MNGLNVSNQTMNGIVTYSDGGGKTISNGIINCTTLNAINVNSTNLIYILLFGI